MKELFQLYGSFLIGCVGGVLVIGTLYGVFLSPTGPMHDLFMTYIGLYM